LDLQFCDITYSDFNLELCFKIDKIGTVNLHKIRNLHKIKNSSNIIKRSTLNLKNGFLVYEIVFILDLSLFIIIV